MITAAVKVLDHFQVKKESFYKKPVVSGGGGAVKAVDVFANTSWFAIENGSLKFRAINQ